MHYSLKTMTGVSNLLLSIKLYKIIEFKVGFFITAANEKEAFPSFLLILILMLQ